MPKKIRELKAMLRQAGWVEIEGGKRSHTKWCIHVLSAGLLSVARTEMMPSVISSEMSISV
jgi:hypothetical protein